MLPLCAVTENSGETCRQVNLDGPQVRFFICIIFPFTDSDVFLLFLLPARGFILRRILKHKQVIKIIGPRAYSPVLSRFIYDWSVVVISVIMETVSCCFPALIHGNSFRRWVLQLFPFFLFLLYISERNIVRVLLLCRRISLCANSSKV